MEAQNFFIFLFNESINQVSARTRKPFGSKAVNRSEPISIRFKSGLKGVDARKVCLYKENVTETSM